jgi:hypothetical protein
MTYYSRYATEKKGIVLRISLLQQVMSCPKLSASLRLMIESLHCCFKAMLDFPKYCMHIIHFQPSVLLRSHWSSSHIVVVSQVPSCHPFYALLVLVYCWSQMSTLHGVGPPLSHVILISHVTSRTILSIIQGNIISNRYQCVFASAFLYPTWCPNGTCESSRSIQYPW